MSDWWNPFTWGESLVGPPVQTRPADEYVLPDAKLVGGRMVPVSDLGQSSTFDPYALQKLVQPMDSAPPPVDDTTRWTPYGPITPITAFDSYALQHLVPATPQQAAQVSAQAQATEAATFTPPIPLGPAVMDPVWLRSDCNCRGGTFVEVPGQPQNSYCLPPSVPTGKMFDVASRGCVPIPGFRRPIVPPYQSYCYYGRYNLCLIGGIAVGALVLWMLLKGKKTKADSKSIAPAITGPGAGI